MLIITSLEVDFKSQTKQASEICPKASEQMSFESPTGIDSTRPKG